LLSRNGLLSYVTVSFTVIVYSYMHLGSLLNGREDEFAKDLYNLSQRPIFDVVAFEDVIDKIRCCVAEVMQCFLFS